MGEFNHNYSRCSGKMEVKMKQSTLISIVIPAFNSEKTIGACLDSLVEQTYKNLEIIVVDGLSDDNTVEIVYTYEKYFNERLIANSEKDTGIYDAMNKGIRIASGTLICILSSNDYFEPNAVQDIANAYDENKPYSIVYGLQRCLRDGREIQVVMYHHSNLPHKMMAHPACFVTKALYNRYGMFDTSYKSSADYEFLWRMYDNPDVTFIPVYKIIANFNMGGMSGTQQGYLETIKLRYSKGQISNIHYNYIQIRCFIGNFVRKVKNAIER
jgi:glycosyltransferase involved in cell wall biosynthesis